MNDGSLGFYEAFSGIIKVEGPLDPIFDKILSGDIFNHQVNMAGSALKARGVGRPIPLFRLFLRNFWRFILKMFVHLQNFELFSDNLGKRKIKDLK